MLQHRGFGSSKDHNFSFTNTIGGKEDNPSYDRQSRQMIGSYDQFRRFYARPPRFSGNYEDFGNRGGFQPVAEGEMEADDDQDAISPQLRTVSSTKEKHPVFNHSSDNNNKSQTIAKYRQEMLELVRNIPEPAYELSLRDLVELPRVTKGNQETSVQGHQLGKDRKKLKKEKKQILRSQSMDSGVFLLKIFPISLGVRRRKIGGAGSKVSPKPMVMDTEKSETENESQNCEESRGETSRSNRSNNSKPRRWKMGGCYSFFHI